uniref:Helicase C-terminal domain-containing protein n=1 Tax=Leersia perrieri TaxID=77586 RepID=A0A0D9VPW8_9ORYZ
MAGFSGDPMAGKHLTPFQQTNNAPQMNGAPRPATNYGAPVATARAPSPRPPMQNATTTSTGAPRPANLAAPGAAAITPKPHPSMQNGTPTTSAPRPANLGASGATAMTPKPHPSMQNAPRMAGAPRPANNGAPGAAARTASPHPAQMQNAPQMSGAPRPAANNGASAATAPSPSRQNAPPTTGVPRPAANYASSGAHPPTPTMMPPAAGQMSSHTVVPGTGIQTTTPRKMRGSIPAMTPAMVPTTVTTVPATRPPHAPLQPTQATPPTTAMAPTFVPAPQAPQAQGAPSMAMQLQPRPQIPYIGVRRDVTTGVFTALVMDPDTNTPRAVGAFGDSNAAALAHDRLEIAFHGVAAARVNFGAGFHGVEHRFLSYLRTMKDTSTETVCKVVANEGRYDSMYSIYLKQTYNMMMDESRPTPAWLMDLKLEFYIERACEIGVDALNGTRDQLVERFVEMHKNKATNPNWREWYFKKKMAQRQQQQGMVNKRKAEDGEDDQQHKRQQQVSPGNSAPGIIACIVCINDDSGHDDASNSWMDPDSRKRQKHGSGHCILSPTQFHSSILRHNRSVRLQFLEKYNDLKCGSDTEDYKAISMKRLELICTLERLQEVPIQLPYSSPLKSSDIKHSLEQNGRNSSCPHITDLDSGSAGDHTCANVDNTSADTTVIVVDSDDADSITSFIDESSSSSKQSVNYIQGNVLPEQLIQHQEISMLNCENISSEAQVIVQKGKDSMDINNVFYNKVGHEEIGKEEGQPENVQIKGTLKKDVISFADSDEPSYEVMQIQSSTNGNFDQYDNNNLVDDLEGLWMDMSLAMSYLKTIGSDHNIVPSESSCEQVEDECHHDFLMKDDLGIVCRICGLIQQRIENIFEFQWKKRKQLYRAHSSSEHRNSSHADANDNNLGTILEVVPDALSIHPQHSQQMKPHQVEGFNFLIKNLVDENNPGGCILAHAPELNFSVGELMIFLCMTSTPKLINGLNNSKSLNLWEESRSILLLGYQQFACIVSDHTSDTEAIMCQEKLLKVPSLVILDEGHTPRNEETDLLTSLENIQTPRKVVLSGTLFQNHVREVFNILNLVRPKFLKMDKSRAIVKSILSKVDLLGKSTRSKNISDKDFYDLVQEHLQKDGNDKMRVMIIQKLRDLTSDVLHYYQGKLLEELPGIVDFTVFLNMSSKQEEIIKGLDGINKFAKRSKCNAVSLHPCLKSVNKADAEDGNVSCRKIGSIISGIDINDGVKAKFIHNLLSLSEAAGEKVLVFSQYVRSLLFLEKLVTRMKGWKPDKHTFKVTGGSTPDQREQAVQRFNNSPDAKVFFGSIKACGEGISLVGSSRIVIVDVHENPAVMRQAIGRAYRPGQSKMVYCYRLVAADSSEEEDHRTAFKKERVSKLWFEWNELCSSGDFELATVDVSDSEDRLLESPALQKDIKALFKR